MKISLALFLVILFTNCGIKKHSTEEVLNEEQPTSNLSTMKITAKIGEINQETVSFRIVAAEVVSNSLILDLEYSGGCTEHTFELIGSANIAKSLPPIRAIELIHDSKGDMCKKLQTTRLEIDIKALAYQQESGSEIYLTLPGWKEKIYYKFD